MEISLWNNSFIFPNGFPEGTDSHASCIGGQAEFNQQCLSQLFSEGHHWAAAIDSDECTLINPRARDPADPMCRFGDHNGTDTLPTQKKSGSVLALLKQQLRKKNNRHTLGDACVAGITRRNFAPKECQDHSEGHSMSHNHHSSLNTSQFATHHWGHHCPGTPIGKATADLSRATPADLVKNAMKAVDLVTRRRPRTATNGSPHRLVTNLCSLDKAWNNDQQNPLILYNYSGSLAQVLFRTNDQRSANGNGTAYGIERFYTEMEKNTGRIAPPGIQDWLDGFVESVSIHEAKRLLKDVGMPHAAANGAYLNRE